MAKGKNKNEKNGISLRNLNFVMSAIAVTVFVIMIVSLYLTAAGYADVREDTSDFILCDQSANDLQAASDYLTEQVRAFAVTGQKEYMDNYFEEANVTQRREKALEHVKSVTGGTEAYQSLETAMSHSVALMEREYYAMKLTALAYGIDLSQCPDAVKNAVLSEADEALPNDKKAETALNMVFDDIYKEYKKEINDATQKSIGYLTQTTESLMEQSFERLNILLVLQRITAYVIIIVLGGIIAVTSLLVIKPLLNAVPRIKEEKPLSLKGAYEYRFLAKTYNRMFELHRAQRKKLKYEATHDVLTGVLNRAGFESVCESGELADYAVLMIDIDNFKHVNDSQGHDAGDRILLKVANEFKKTFRTSDYICRIGGDEFTVIMNGIAAEEDRIQIIKNKITGINDNLAKRDYGLPAISVSAGVAFGSADSNINDVIKDADDELYEVKRHGKHNISFHE